MSKGRCHIRINCHSSPKGRYKTYLYLVFPPFVYFTILWQWKSARIVHIVPSAFRHFVYRNIEDDCKMLNLYSFICRSKGGWSLFTILLCYLRENKSELLFFSFRTMFDPFKVLDVPTRLAACISDGLCKSGPHFITSSINNNPLKKFQFLFLFFLIAATCRSVNRIFFQEGCKSRELFQLTILAYTVTCRRYRTSNRLWVRSSGNIRQNPIDWYQQLKWRHFIQSAQK